VFRGAFTSCGRTARVGKSTLRWEDNIKMDLVWFRSMLAMVHFQRRAAVMKVMKPLGFIEGWEFFD